MDKKIFKRYSEAFKREVVREYEGGASATSLRKKYGIQDKNNTMNYSGAILFGGCHVYISVKRRSIL